MNILVAGNGFDIAHGLPTKYSDFLYVMSKIIKTFSLYPLRNGYDINDTYRLKDMDKINMLLERENGKHIEADTLMIKFKDEIIRFEEKNKDLLMQNDWLRYYVWVFAGLAKIQEYDSWIDIEEKLAECLIKLYPKITKEFLEDHAFVDVKEFNQKSRMYTSMKFPFIFSKMVMCEKCWEREYLLKWTYDKLFQQMIDFSELLRDYLLLVEKYYYSKPLETRKAFREFSKGGAKELLFAISFNYTDIILDYINVSYNISYINGKLNSDRIILGIEDFSDSQKFSEAKKYIHRFFKSEQHVNYDYYYDYFDMLNVYRTKIENGIIIHFLGHSLHRNDAKILLSVMKHPFVNKVIIYFYNGKDKIEKIERLHELLGNKDFFECVNNTSGEPEIILLPTDELMKS